MFGILSDQSVGIELTAQRLLVAEVRRKRDRFYLEKVAQSVIPAHVLEDGKVKQVDTMAELLRQTMRDANIRSKNVHLVVPSQYVVIRHLQLPDLPYKPLRKLIDFELQQSIHLPFDDPVYDFVKTSRDPADLSMIESEEDMPVNPQADVTLIASSRSTVDPLLASVKKAGLKAVALDIRALALSRAYRRLGHDKSQMTTMFVDVAETSTDIHIFQGDVLKFTRNIPMSFENYVIDRERNQPLDALGVLEYFQGNTDFRSFTQDLTYEVDRSVNFFRYTLNNRESSLDGIILTGVLPKSGVMAEFLQERFPDTPVRAMSFDGIELSTAAEPARSTLYEFAIPIGLAMKEVK